MAEYLVVDLRGEDSWGRAEPQTAEKIHAEHGEFGQKHGAALRGGNALQPTSAATSVRRDATGNVSVTDGAFAETKEALGGYYLIEAADLDEALLIAKDVPAHFGGVEARPIRDMG